MTLEQLRIFIAVAEQEHVTKAAQTLNLTQSATSAAVAALERRYQTKLFHRVGRRIELTEAGKLFLIEARAVLTRAQAAEMKLADLAGLKTGSIQLAASQTIANYWLPPRMTRFRKAYPDIDLHLRIGNSREVAAWLREGNAELGCIEGTTEDPHLHAKTVAEDELILIAPRGMIVDNPNLRSLADYADMPWVFREPGSGTRALVEKHLLDSGIDLRKMPIDLELPSNEAVLSAVASGAGVSILSRLVAEPALSAGHVSDSGLSIPGRRFYMVRRKESPFSVAASAFAKELG